jgi:pimeloyl-ACP methyl ester carboxylesterase
MQAGRAMPEVEQRTVPVAAQDGPLDVHLTEAGSGPPLLLLHGWPQHAWAWRKLIPLLAGDFRLLMPDLRGFGRSATPAGGYDPSTFAEDAVALLDALGLDEVGVVGHDWGGFTAYLLGLRHPNRVRALVVCNAPHPWPPLNARAALELWRAWYVTVVASPAGARVVASERFIPWFLRLGGRAHVFGDADAERYAAPLREAARARASQQLYRSYLRAVRDVYVRKPYQRRRLTVPTRAVFGREDFYIPVASTLRAEPHADDWSVRLLDGCGHWTPEERPDVVAETARALFSRPADRRAEREGSRSPSPQG